MVGYNQINPMDVGAYVQEGFDKGRERGRATYLNRLAGEAYAAPADQRQGYLARLIGQDAQMGTAMAGHLEQSDAGKQKRQAELLAQGAGIMVGMSPEQRAQAYPALRQRFVAMDPEMGAMLPEQYDDAQMWPMIQQITGGQDADVFAQKVGADGFIYNTMRDGRMVNTGVKADRQMWFANNPGVDPYLVGKGGDVTMVGPGGQTPAPPPAFAGSGGDPKADSIMQAANAMVAAGVPSAQVDAFVQQSLAAAGLSPQMPPHDAPAGAGTNVPTTGGAGGLPAPAAPVGPPGRNPLTRPVADGAEESFSQPQPVTDPQTGEVRMVQFGNRGSIRPVAGYAPPPTARDNKPPTEGERGAAGYLGRMRAAETLLGGISEEGYTPTTADYYTAGRGPILNQFSNDTAQRWRQAQEDWVRAKLRKESGAAIPADEMDREISMYFPMPGDSPGVIAQKAASRKQAEAQMQSMAGRATPVPSANPPAATGGQYQPGQVIEVNGKRYRVIGGDPNDPDVEEVI